MADDSDLLEDLLAFLYAAGDEPREFDTAQPGETVICAISGRELAEGESYSSNGDSRCAECEPEG